MKPRILLSTKPRKFTTACICEEEASGKALFFALAAAAREVMEGRGAESQPPASVSSSRSERPCGAAPSAKGFSCHRATTPAEQR